MERTLATNGIKQSPKGCIKLQAKREKRKRTPQEMLVKCMKPEEAIMFKPRKEGKTMRPFFRLSLSFFKDVFPVGEVNSLHVRSLL